MVGLCQKSGIEIGEPNPYSNGSDVCCYPWLQQVSARCNLITYPMDMNHVLDVTKQSPFEVDGSGWGAEITYEKLRASLHRKDQVVYLNIGLDENIPQVIDIPEDGAKFLTDAFSNDRCGMLTSHKEAGLHLKQAYPFLPIRG
ncbi:hypothetical protein CYMTET_41931 [Cymbomonas tetramitiformis]|uniref:Uncharacterized protein n=1 Tax=Cymbomonas tetramitiformis TaxID=36881 RepID=A0AAE0C722_9CHLO|nr:hypothetical protein CYMTET_41931 [Cymbomonas tetramitiformis]